MFEFGNNENRDRDFREMKIKSADSYDSGKTENIEKNDNEINNNNNFSKILSTQDQNYDKKEINNKVFTTKKKQSAQILKEIIGKSRDFDSKNNKNKKNNMKNNDNDDESDFSDEEEELEKNRKDKEMYERQDGRSRERGSGGNNVLFQDDIDNEELSDEDEEVCTVRTFPS